VAYSCAIQNVPAGITPTFVLLDAATGDEVDLTSGGTPVALDAGPDGRVSWLIPFTAPGGAYRGQITAGQFRGLDTPVGGSGSGGSGPNFTLSQLLTMIAQSPVGSVAGDVAGKVLGGGSGTISGIGSRSIACTGDGRILTDYAGTCRAASTTTVVKLDALDALANSMASGPTNLCLYVARGTGANQLIPLSSVTGATGARDARVQDGYIINPLLSTDSQYSWEPTPSTAGVDVSGIADEVLGGMADVTVAGVANLEGIALASGTVSASPTPQATAFRATGNSLNALPGGYASVPQTVLWQTGALAGFRFAIVGHSTSGTNPVAHDFIVAAMPRPPAAGDQFKIG
jgi:hypothetical protein